MSKTRKKEPVSTSDKIWAADGNAIWEDYMAATPAAERTPQGAIAFTIGWLSAMSASDGK